MVRIAAAAVLALAAGASSALFANCGPFTDVAADNFCPFVLEIFYLGITTGTTPTTFDPDGHVTRLQMAAFLSRSVDGILRRGSRRALLKKFWTPQNALVLGATTFGAGEPIAAACDGRDIWAADGNSETAWRVRGSDGRLLETWTGADGAFGVIAATGRILISAGQSPGRLYSIDPRQSPGAVTTVASNLGNQPRGIAFDGARFWTANNSGTVSIVTPGAAVPWTVTTVATGAPFLYGMLYDGASFWATGGSSLLKFDGNGAVLQTITLGPGVSLPGFDGTNIWVAGDTSVAVVRAATGAVLATLTGNGLDGTNAAAFDGERVLVTNGLGASVSLWKAADLTSLGSFETGGSPAGACSDGFAFWIATNNGHRLVRF